MQPRTGGALVDYLFPEQEGFEAIREAALLVDEDAGARTMLESLRTAATQPEMPTEGDFVRVMSLHKSKGLTSKVVIVAGCLEGLIPFIDTDQPQAAQLATLQEQRRLFYVAITRATDILVLSSASQLQRNIAYKMGVRVRGRGMTVGTIASRFLGIRSECARRSVWTSVGTERVPVIRCPSNEANLYLRHEAAARRQQSTSAVH